MKRNYTLSIHFALTMIPFLLFVSGCRAGQFLGPAFTPTPTATSTPTPTPTMHPPLVIGDITISLVNAFLVDQIEESSMGFIPKEGYKFVVLVVRAQYSERREPYITMFMGITIHDVDGEEYHTLGEVNYSSEGSGQNNGEVAKYCASETLSQKPLMKAGEIRDICWVFSIKQTSLVQDLTFLYEDHPVAPFRVGLDQ